MKVILALLLCFLPFLSALSEKNYTPPDNITTAQELLARDAKVYRDQGYRLQSMGDLQGALMHYQKAYEMDPDFVEVANDIGVVYEALGDEERALEMYRQAVEIDPNYLGAYTNLAFLYEKRGDVQNAVKYWTKRYELGRKGDYWWEVSRQHLLKLGAYPKIRKEMLEKKAAVLSRELIYRREQERFDLIEEAQLHFEVGNQAFIEGDYEVAVNECKTILSLNPPDEELKNKTRVLYQEAQKLYLKQQALVNTKDALDYINNEDYLSAADKLKSSLTAVFRITQE